MRKVYVDVYVRLIIHADDSISIDNVLSNMDVVSQTNEADIEDVNIVDWSITDSK